MSPKTGILFNNQITDFIISKSIQANQMNTPQPNKTPQTSMAPVILTDKDGNVKIVLGSSGGKVIITAILQVGIIRDVLSQSLLVFFKNKQKKPKLRKEVDIPANLL